MFILRRIDSEFGEINTNLGDYYALISKEKNPEKFNETVKLWEKDVIEEINAVVVFDDDNGLIIPIYNESQYYVMTSDGRTFANISNK